MAKIAQSLIRRRLDLRGQVQGVGFRPFVYRLASMLDLAGYVANSSLGAMIEVEGVPSRLSTFERQLTSQLPPLARISGVDRTDLPLLGDCGFHIKPSQSDATTKPSVTPDSAVCSDCLAELFDPADRRYRYPFINCTNCGPRYSIIRSVPYDRPATTMAEFAMCAACQAEYDDPQDRRFHAQPNACRICGPRVELCRADRSRIDGDAIGAAAAMLNDGAIVAIKGIGGYHLACRADLEASVARLRVQKLRDGKPLAMMVRDLDTARCLCDLSETDAAVLASMRAPIVLAPQRDGSSIAPSVAPRGQVRLVGGDYGVMLPYTPLHYLLFAEGLADQSGLPALVMTSANLAGQPLTYCDAEALRNLGDIADAFLMHDREIFRPIDDSVVFCFRDHAVPIRRARGYAPEVIRIGAAALTTDERVLAVGADLKSTICLYTGGEAILSEHLGDLTHPDTHRSFLAAIGRLKDLFDFEPEVVACDMHPQYLSTQYARRLRIPTEPVQHHHAHIVSLMAEWEETEPVIGIACDGSGFGTDGAVWGCEILRCRLGDFDRLGHLDYFPLIGGDAAATDTWRPAAALLQQALGEDWRSHLEEPSKLRQHVVGPRDLDVIEQQTVAGLNTPPSSSLGRVFDAVAFLAGLCSKNRHEAEAAVALEAAAGRMQASPYPYSLSADDGAVRMSLVPTIEAIVDDVKAGASADRIASSFHESVATMLADAAEIAVESAGAKTVALSGGCFANRLLLHRLVELLENRRLRVLYHRRVPCGDGGIALGQAVVAAWRVHSKQESCQIAGSV